MTLLTAHRILISSAIAFFLFYGLWELGGFNGAGSDGATLRGTCGLLAAAGFAVYLRTVKRK